LEYSVPDYVEIIGGLQRIGCAGAEVGGGHDGGRGAVELDDASWGGLKRGGADRNGQLLGGSVRTLLLGGRDVSRDVDVPCRVDRESGSACKLRS
jgi:hypothetical protein